MPKQNKNNDISGAVTVKPKKSPPKKTKKTTTKTPEKKKRGAPSQYANKVKPYLADIERYVRQSKKSRFPQTTPTARKF